MVNVISNIFKFLIGFLFAMAILVGGGVATAFYFMTRVAPPPTKPIFANDPASVKKKADMLAGVAKRETAISSVKRIVKPTAAPAATPSPQPLPPGAYRASVTWSEGLILRSQPSLDAERVGGLGFNQKIVVLEESSDKNWQKVRLEDGQQEGWVKAGNTKRTE